MTDVAKSPHAGMRPLVVTATIGAIVYTVDAVLLGQGALGVAASFLGMVVALVKIGGALGRRSSRDALVQLAAFLLWIGFAVGIVASVAFQAKISRARAERVVAACRAYHEAEGRYPDELGALVPKYLPTVPRARVAFAFDSFLYMHRKAEVGSEEHTLLVYTTVPPFGRVTYDFEHDRWGSLD